ncbi:hypothetical protein N9O56_03415, partial [Rickettsiales bacterium]|nr:hypothetical protein [Rickettsiales bacterium]
MSKSGNKITALSNLQLVLRSDIKIQKIEAAQSNGVSLNRKQLSNLKELNKLLKLAKQNLAQEITDIKQGPAL